MKQYKKDLIKPWWDKYPEYLPLGAKWRGLWQKGTVKCIIQEIDDRKLDIEIAEKVFGYKVEVIEKTEYHEFGGETNYPVLGYKIKERENQGCIDDGFPEFWYEEFELPYYSTKIEDAMTILNEINVCFRLDRFDSNYYEASFNDEYIGDSETPEIAICKAALNYMEKQ